MPEKCCCGCCTLSTGTAVALIFSAIQATVGLLWNIELLLLLNAKSGSFNPLQHVINSHAIEDFDVVHGLTLAAVGLNGFWLIFAIIAARGNIVLSHGHLTFWDVCTYLITFFDMGTTIFFAIKLQASYAESDDFYMGPKPTRTLTYVTLLVAFSKGGILMLVNIYLAHVVQRRGKEIDNDHSVLALYVMSHLAQCHQRTNESRPHHPGAPPAYASSCPTSVTSPPSCDPRSDSSGSQWSLSYDAIQNMSHDPPKYFPGTETNMYPSLGIARALSRNPSSCSQTLSVDTDTSPILPY